MAVNTVIAVREKWLRGGTSAIIIKDPAIKRMKRYVVLSLMKLPESKRGTRTWCTDNFAGRGAK